MQDNTALEICVDFILNRCSVKDLDVIIAAVKRRKQSMSGRLSFDAETMSKRINEQINSSIQQGMAGMTNSLRQFSADLLAKEAPELSQVQANAIVESWIPDMSFDGEVKSISKNGKVGGIPSTLLFDMILQFVSFGIGEMEQTKDNELKAEMGNWQEKYWKAFPKKIKQAIKTFFDGEITYGEFTKTIKLLLDIR